MSGTTTITIRVPRQTRDALGKIADSARRSKSFVAAEVLDAYIQQQAWYAKKIAAARRSPIVPDKEVEAFFQRWTRGR